MTIGFGLCLVMAALTDHFAVLEFVFGQHIGDGDQFLDRDVCFGQHLKVGQIRDAYVMESG